MIQKPSARLKSTRWNVRRTLRAFSIETVWKVLPLCQRSSEWITHDTISVTALASYRKCVSVGVSSQTKWSVRKIKKHSAKVSYYSDSIIQVIRKAVFDTHIGVVIDCDATYNTQKKIVKYRTAKAHVCVPVSVKKNVSWHILKPVYLIHGKWSVMQLVNKSLDGEWGVGQLAGKWSEASWLIEHPNIVATMKWREVYHVSTQASISSRITLTVGKQTSTVWQGSKSVHVKAIVKYRRHFVSRFIKAERSVLRPNEVKGAFLPRLTIDQMSPRQKHRLKG